MIENRNQREGFQTFVASWSRNNYEKSPKLGMGTDVSTSFVHGEICNGFVREERVVYYFLSHAFWCNYGHFIPWVIGSRADGNRENVRSTKCIE